MTDLPLKFVAGHPALDFVNTVDWPDPAGERLTRYDRVAAWSEEAGLLAHRAAARLRARASREPRRAAAALARALSSRALLHRLFARRATGTLAPADLRDFNRLLGDLGPRRQLIATGRVQVWAWREEDRHLDAPLWPVLWSAAELLASEEADQIRVCPGEGCGWMFVDRSRNGLRRWCEMRTCGTAEKARRRARSR